jgi:hypothetical protein
MAIKTISAVAQQTASITDTIIFDLYTTNSDGSLCNPYCVNQVTIYLIERNYIDNSNEQYNLNLQGFLSTFYYQSAAPLAIFGDDTTPAWDSTDTQDAFITQITFTPNGDIDTGHFQLTWQPSDNAQVQPGDYLLCYQWTPIFAGDSFSQIIYFYLGGDFAAPTIPSHQTNPLKYPTLLDRYTPDMFKQYLAPMDITPQTIQNTNLAVADGFTELENLNNQLVDLYDANVVQEVFLPYLANMFRWKLRSNDPTLWRRQVRQAVNLYKRKGTLGGLKEALAESGIQFRKITYYWQVVSQATWQEAFIVQPGQTVFCLSKVALPVDANNFHVWYRASGSAAYLSMPLSDVQFTTTTSTNANCENNTFNTTCVTWIGDIVLGAGDVVLILYKIAEPVNQGLEDYIQTLNLADQRDVLTVTYPVKNWNERLIAEDDLLFPLIVPIKHPFAYPVVYGKVRTEFPYSEQIYNMDEYSGSIRDSTDPCDLDYTFYDTCTGCRSSAVSIDVAIEELSNDRISETEEILMDFLPFHAVLYSINYVGWQDDIIPPPVEELECLIQYNLQDDIFCSQFDFDRLILDANNPQNIQRDMLADANTVAMGNDGVGYNLAYSLFSPGIQLDSIGINNNANLLEILSGTNQGQYTLQNQPGASADVLGISQFPLDPSGFPFRFSNIQYTEMGASIYQDNLVIFTDPNVDFSLFPIPNDSWTITVTAGPNMGNYPIISMNSDNTMNLANWTAGSAFGFAYQLNAPGNINVMSGTSGQVTVVNRGRLQTQPLDLNTLQKGDYVLMNGIQYPILFVNNANQVYLQGYSGGDQVGTQNIKILRRLIDNVVGYLHFRGLMIKTTMNYETSLGIQNGQNPVAVFLDNSDFKENYLILIGTQYFQMADINGQSIYLSGPVQAWGLVGQAGITYTIIQIVNQQVPIQSGIDGTYNTFQPFVDRRGEGSNFVQQDSLTASPMVRMQMLNNESQTIKEAVKTKESISYKIIHKEDK